MSDVQVYSVPAIGGPARVMTIAGLLVIAAAAAVARRRAGGLA